MCIEFWCSKNFIVWFFLDVNGTEGLIEGCFILDVNGADDLIQGCFILDVNGREDLIEGCFTEAKGAQ